MYVFMPVVFLISLRNLFFSSVNLKLNTVPVKDLKIEKKKINRKAYL